MDKEEKLELKVKTFLNQLEEEFDLSGTILFCNFINKKNNEQTMGFKLEVGNHYANLGQVREFVIQEEALQKENISIDVMLFEDDEENEDLD